MPIKSKTYGVGGYSITRTKERSSDNWDRNGVMPGVIYGKGDQMIKTKKSTIINTPKSMRTKVTTYGPIGYYGRQTKSVQKVHRKK
jgi:hypothetical protein